MNMVDFYFNMYGPGEGQDEVIDKGKMDLRKELFWAGVRTSLYKKVHSEKDCYFQWAFITGKKTQFNNGERISLSRRNLNHFERIVEYLNTAEGLDNLHNNGIFDDPPEDVDSLIEIISGAMTDRQIKKEIFNFFRRYRDKILNMLSE